MIDREGRFVCDNCVRTALKGCLHIVGGEAGRLDFCCEKCLKSYVRKVL